MEDEEERKAQAHTLRHLRRRQAAVHGVHGRSSRVGGRAAAQGGGKGLEKWANRCGF